METHPREGVVKEEKLPNNRKPSHWQVCGEFWNLRGQHNWGGVTTHRIHALITPSGEIAQTLTSATSKRGLNREALASLFRVRTRTECPEENLRELT